MASTTSNRLKLSHSASQLFSSLKPSSRNKIHEPRLFLKRVIGTTCASPTGFDTSERCFAYIAGGAVVVVELEGAEYSQRFYRARPTATPVFAVAPVPNSRSSPGTTHKANDARNRVVPSSREPLYGTPAEWGDSPSSRTWTSRERIKPATCVSLSKDGRFLAVGETGYNPRVLVFSLKDDSSNKLLFSISEHGFGVVAVAWSPDGRYLASLGTPNDGFLFVWKIDPRTGSARLFQQNRCTSYVSGMMWLGNNLITFGTRHLKTWRVVDDTQQPPSPLKRTYGGALNAQKTLPGRNVLLGSLLEVTFTCATTLDENYALLCSDGGDICLLDGTKDQMQLTRVAGLDFPVKCCAQHGSSILIGGKDSQLITLGLGAVLRCDPKVTVANESAPTALVAMGFVQDQLVTINTDRSIDIVIKDFDSVRLPGHSDPVLGVQSLARADETDTAFFTFSGTGKVLLWGLNGRVQKILDFLVDEVPTGNELEPINSLCVVRADKHGRIFAAGDRIGFLRVLDYSTGESLLDIKAHSSEITHIAVHYSNSRAFIATCGRDRTAQIFYRTSNGSFDLLQTLEFPARVTHLLLSPNEKIITCSMDRNIRVHEVVSKEGEPDTLAAVQSRTMAVKASPNSMTLSHDSRTLFASCLDKSIYHFDVDSGRQLSTFKCTDESGSETAVLDSLVYGAGQCDEPPFLLGMSNTDKSVRVYDASTGAFLDREWGHTESINGVDLVSDEENLRKVISVGCDGTIMIWDLELSDSSRRSTSRSPSPAKEASQNTNKPPLRRVLSKAELADFQRPSSSHGANRPSSSRGLKTRKSRHNLSTSSSAKTPTAPTFGFSSPYNSSAVEDTPSRKTSSTRSGSPPLDVSPPQRLSRRPSMPALGTTPPPHHVARKKNSAIGLRSSYGFGSLQMASEQTCRQLRTYRKKLSSAEPITPETIAELEAELHLTTAAIGERASRNKQAVADSLLNGLLDQYSDKLLDMLEGKLRLRLEGESDCESIRSLGVSDGLATLHLQRRSEHERPRTASANI